MVLIRDVKSPGPVILPWSKWGDLESRNVSYLNSEYVRLRAVFAATAVIGVSVALDINSKSS